VDWEGRGDGRVLGFAAGGEGAWDSDRLENGGTRFRLGRSNGPGAVAADVSAVSNDDSLGDADSERHAGLSFIRRYREARRK
jgi:hypothetical protein